MTYPYVLKLLIWTEITTQPVSLTTVVTLEDVVNCSASIDDVTYSWHHVDDDLPFRSRWQNSNTLTIPRATPHDEGMYYCMASKEGVSVESNRAILIVDGKLYYCSCTIN